MTMFEIVILASALLLIIRAIYLYYKPSIDIIVTSTHKKVYLWYNSWEDRSYKGRVYICILSWKK